MKNIILPIKPEYSQKIFNNEKKFEYRTRVPNKKIEKIFVYETFPTKKIVGYFYVDQIIKHPINQMWNLTHKLGGIDYTKFFNYFKDSEFAYAYKIKKVVKYKKPLSLQKFGINFPPQSYIYLE